MFKIESFFITAQVMKAWGPPYGQSEEFKLVTVYGPLGYGKSTYACRVGAQLLQAFYPKHTRTQEETWELLKQFIIFHPSQFFAKLREIRDIGLRRLPFLIWDDAGLWLFALEWNDPFIVNVAKWLNVARSRLASLIMTTPTPDYIFKKGRKFPQGLNVKIIKRNDGLYNRKVDRLGVIYRQDYHVIKGYIIRRLKHMDPFNHKMPDQFFKWYKPLRDSYEEMALDLMAMEWQKTQGRSKIIQLENRPEMQVPKLNIRHSPYENL